MSTPQAVRHVRRALWSEAIRAGEARSRRARRGLRPGSRGAGSRRTSSASWRSRGWRTHRRRSWCRSSRHSESRRRRRAGLPGIVAAADVEGRHPPPRGSRRFAGRRGGVSLFDV